MASPLELAASLARTMDEAQQIDGNEALRRLVEIDKVMAEREAEMSALKEERERLEPFIMQHFEQNGVERVRVDGRTIYIERKVWAKLKAEKLLVCEALLECGMDQYVETTFNRNSLSAWLRRREEECAERGEELTLPEPLDSVLGYSEVFKVRTRKTN